MSADPHTPTSLEAANEVFHEAYGATREGAQHDVPILVVLPTELALHHRGERRPFGYARDTFATAKSAAHIAVGLYVMTEPETLDAPGKARLSRLIEHLRRSLEELQQIQGEPMAHEVRPLLELCSAFAKGVQEQASSPAVREAFARNAGPRLLRITDLATKDQISGLHEAVERAFAQLSPAEQEALQVVVVGDHQARVRSLGMQYFQRRLREPPGADHRVTYGENIANEQEALALVGTRQLDRVIARAFFGDEKRLQRDVLGDAAERCLEEMAL